MKDVRLLGHTCIFFGINWKKDTRNFIFKALILGALTSTTTLKKNLICFLFCLFQVVMSTDASTSSSGTPSAPPTLPITSHQPQTLLTLPVSAAPPSSLPLPNGGIPNGAAPPLSIPTVTVHSAPAPAPPPPRDGLRLPLLVDAALALSSASEIITTSGKSALPAAPTLTTPTLTPTTLRNIEQMFLETENNQNGVGGGGALTPGGIVSHLVQDEIRPPELHAFAAGFEPPNISLQMSSGQHVPQEYKIVKDEEPSSWVADGSVLPGPHSSGSVLPGPHSNDVKPHIPVAPVPQVELPSVPVRLLPTEPVNNNLPNGSAVPSIVVSSPPESLNPPPAKQRKASSGGGRRPAPTSSLTPVEEQKKILRRQRNKEAAARCRKRRMDQTMTLQEEVDKLEAERGEMSEEIKALEEQKKELEVLLRTHRASCKVPVSKAGQKGS